MQHEVSGAEAAVGHGGNRPSSPRLNFVLHHLPLEDIELFVDLGQAFIHILTATAFIGAVAGCFSRFWNFIQLPPEVS